MTSTTPLTLYVWPSRWNLPSIDAGCIEAILFLQLACPGRYSVVETTDLDASPNGHLPYLVHSQVVVASVPSIISYLKSLSVELLTLSNDDDREEDESLPSINPAIDDKFSSRDRSQIPAWRAYVEGQIGNLVAHSLYVLDPNYELIHKTLASMMPFPQRYYAPRRIRDSYKPRLEAAGLWHVNVKEEEKIEKSFDHTRMTREYKRTVRKTFDKAQLHEKAKHVLDILVNLLRDKDFIFGDRPSTVDLVLASRILLLGAAPLPEPVLKELLTASYPSLIIHATRVHALAFSQSNPPPSVSEPKGPSFFQVMGNSIKSLERYLLTDHLETEEDKKFRRYRYGWYALTTLTAVGYFAVLRFQRIVVVVVANKQAQVPNAPETTEASPSNTLHEEEREKSEEVEEQEPEQEDEEVAVEAETETETEAGAAGA